MANPLFSLNKFSTQQTLPFSGEQMNEIVNE